MNINLDELKKRYGMDKDIRNNPKYQELKDHYQNKERAKAEELEKLKQIRDEMNSQKEGVDIAPLVALTDTWTGSNLMSAYRRPEQDRQKNLMNKFNMQSGITNVADRDVNSAYAKLKMIVDEEENQKRMNLAILKSKTGDHSALHKELSRRHDIAIGNQKGSAGKDIKKRLDLSHQGLATLRRFMSDRSMTFTDKNATDISALLTTLITGGVPGKELIKDTEFVSLGSDTEKIKQYLLGKPMEYYSADIMDNLYKQFENYYKIKAQKYSEYQAKNRNASRNIINTLNDRSYDYSHGGHYKMNDQDFADALTEKEIMEKLYKDTGWEKITFADAWNADRRKFTKNLQGNSNDSTQAEYEALKKEMELRKGRQK